MLTVTTTTMIARETAVYELVVYNISSDYLDNFHEVLNHARDHIGQLPGMLNYQTFWTTERSLTFMDLVQMEISGGCLKCRSKS